jgi:hypothetical protein
MKVASFIASLGLVAAQTNNLLSAEVRALYEQYRGSLQTCAGRCGFPSDTTVINGIATTTCGCDASCAVANNCCADYRVSCELGDVTTAVRYEIIETVQVQKPYNVPVVVNVPQPYPVPVNNPVPVGVANPIAIAVNVPVDFPIGVNTPVNAPYPVPVPVNFPVPVPVGVPVSINVPVPVGVPVNVPFPQAVAVNNPVNVPYNVPVPVAVSTPVNAPFNSPRNVPVTVPVNFPIGINNPVGVPVNVPFNNPVGVPVNNPIIVPTGVERIIQRDVPVPVPVPVFVNNPIPVDYIVQVEQRVNVPVNAPQLVNVPVAVGVNNPVGVPVNAPFNVPVSVNVPYTVVEEVQVPVNVPKAVSVNVPVVNEIRYTVEQEVLVDVNRPVETIQYISNPVAVEVLVGVGKVSVPVVVGSRETGVVIEGALDGIAERQIDRTEVIAGGVTLPDWWTSVGASSDREVPTPRPGFLGTSTPLPTAPVQSRACTSGSTIGNFICVNGAWTTNSNFVVTNAPLLPVNPIPRQPGFLSGNCVAGTQPIGTWVCQPTNNPNGDYAWVNTATVVGR